MFWKAFGKYGHAWSHDAVIDCHFGGKASKHHSGSGKGSHDGWGKGSHDGSGKGTKGSHDGSGKGTKGSHDGSGKGTKGSHDGSGKGTKGSHDGSGKGTKGSHDGSGKGTKGSHDGSGKGTKGSHDGSGKGSHGSHGTRGSHGTDDCGCHDYVCGGNEQVTVQVLENTTAVFDIDTATSGGGASDDGVLYSIIGGADSDLFEVDVNTGEVSFVSAPDFEAPADDGADNVYDVVVRSVSVTEPGRFTDTELSVEVTDVEPESGGGPNVAPQITNEPDAPVETVQTVVAVFDVDAFDADGDTLEFFITGGADQDTFSIDQSTGVVSRIETVSRFGSADGDEVYTVEVEVRDGNGGVDAATLDIAFVFGG